MQAAEGEKKKRPKSSNDDNSQTETNTEVKGSHSQENDRKWKRQRLGFIKNPVGQRAKYYMEIMPAFFKKINRMLQLTVSSRLNFAKREQDNMRPNLLLKTLNRT